MLPRFIGKVAATEDGEAAKIHNYLDTEKIEQEALYDDKTGFSSRRYTHKSPFPYLFPCISDISLPLERDLENAFSCETILDKLRTMNFANIQEQGFIPLYTRDKLTDALHTVYGFETDYKFITKRQMKNIQKKSKGRK